MRLNVSRIGWKIFCISFFLALIPTTAFASAGYYPIKKGEILNAEVCLPNEVRPPISLQLNSGEGKPVTVFKIKSFVKKVKPCGKEKTLVAIRWKVDREGIYALSFYDPRSKKIFFGWPDGVEIRPK